VFSHDSVIIAYDALLGANGNWIEFLKRGALHGGDSDSTAAIGAAWFGVLYGFQGVPENHYKKLEYLDDIRVRLFVLLFVLPPSLTRLVGTCNQIGPGQRPLR